MTLQHLARNHVKANIRLRSSSDRRPDARTPSITVKQRTAGFSDDRGISSFSGCQFRERVQQFLSAAWLRKSGGRSAQDVSQNLPISEFLDSAERESSSFG